MNVLGLQIFVSLMLVLGAIVALLYSVKQGDHEHADRLSILPLDEDENARPAPGPPGAGSGAGPGPATATQPSNPSEGD